MKYKPRSTTSIREKPSHDSRVREPRDGRLQVVASSESQRQPKLCLELPAFEHAVLYHQATAVGASGTAVLAPRSQLLTQLSNPDGGGLIVLNDPEVLPRLPIITAPRGWSPLIPTP